MKKIKLSGKLGAGKYALVDDGDYERLSKFKWLCHNAGYATRYRKNGDGKRLQILMHREVVGAKEGELTDHINRNRLDNRRGNLRIVTPSQNQRNQGKKGCSWKKGHNKWWARIRIDGKQKFLGYFDTEREAREAYLVEYNKCF